MNVYNYAENVPETGSAIFNNTPISTATLHVPAASINAYKYTTPWYGFGNIVALNGDDPSPTEIREIESEQLTGAEIIYNLQGKRLNQPSKGINIINGKKVLVK